MFVLRYALLTAGLIPLVSGQTTHIVTVGVQGSFFTPPTISAEVGDIVTFVFAGDKHDVTQGSFEEPCVPLPGGFSSSVVGTGTDFSDPILSWDLHITNSSAPIWFFCIATLPFSHCEEGMVGAINPPSINMFNAYMSAAKRVTSTPTPSPTVVILSGQGAFATNSPIASVTFASSLLDSTPISTSTSSATTKNTKSKQPVGAIVGGAVGGGAALIILIVLSFLLYRTRKKSPSRTTSSPSLPPPSFTGADVFYKHPPSPGPKISPSSPSHKLEHSPSTSSFGDRHMPAMNFVSAPTRSQAAPTHYGDEQAHSPPGRRPRPLPQPGVIRRQASHPQINAIDQPSAPVNINALAREVAVLLQSPQGATSTMTPAMVSKGSAPELRGHWQQPRDHYPDISGSATPAPPPQYRSG